MLPWENLGSSTVAAGTVSAISLVVELWAPSKEFQSSGGGIRSLVGGNSNIRFSCFESSLKTGTRRKAYPDRQDLHLRGASLYLD